MPKKATGTHSLTVLRSFCHRLAEEPYQGPACPLQRLGLTLEEVDLSGLSSKALTLLLQGRHQEKDAGFKVRRKDRRHVKAFLALATRAEQHKVLLRNEVWVYQEAAGREVDDNKVLKLFVEEEEEEEEAAEECCNLGCDADSVDWGGSDDEEEVEEEEEEEEKEEEEEGLAKGPLEAYPEPPVPKRQRVKGPGPEPLLKAGWKALIGTVDSTSRIACEIGPVYCFGFGNSAYKPAVLRRWGEMAETCQSLQCVAARENGNLYYSARPLSASPSATWLLENGGTLEKVYCRMPLLLSTLQRRSMGIIFAESLPEEKNACGVDPRDGMAEMSLAFAQRHSLIAAADFLNDCYRPCQFRGIFKLRNEGEATCLAKGMAVINPALPGETFILPESCIKVRGPALDAESCYGMDITAATRPMAQPRLTASLLAMLRARVKLATRRRGALDRKLMGLVKKCKEYTWQVFKEKSFGVEHTPPEGIDLLPIRDDKKGCQDRKDDPWIEKRAAFHNIRFQMSRTGNELPTPLEDLEVEEEELEPHKLAHKTREALGRGSVSLWGNYRQQRRKPRLHIPAVGATVTALSDYTNTLEDRQCYVISNGHALVGEAAVWRCPCQCPWDIELWDARPLPEELEGLVPDDVIIVSRKGFGNSRMAGGDYDGDLNMVSFHVDLVALVKETEADIWRLPLEAIDQDVKGELAKEEAALAAEEDEKAEQGQISRRRELQAAFAAGEKATAYLQYCVWLPTPRLRGWACSQAERFAQIALKKPAASHWNSFFTAALTGHKAMDVPKHYRAESLVATMKRLVSDGGVKRSMARSTKAVCDGAQGLRLIFPSLRRHNTFEAVTEWLDEQGLAPYGAVWLPHTEVVLGEEAADRVLEILRTRPKHLNFFERSAARKPIAEIAGYVAHKLSRSIGEPGHYPQAGAAAIIQAIEGAKMTPLNTTGALYRSTFLQ